MGITYKQQRIIQNLENLQQFVGNTSLFSFDNISPNPQVRILAKVEWQQFGGSVKSRAAFEIVKQAVLEGKLDGKRRLLDATSGNTGISYAAIGAKLGIPVTICIPENASSERKNILRALGAEIIFTPPFESTDGAQEVTREMIHRNADKYFLADQYNNNNNWLAHYNGTAEEIIQQTNGTITHFVAGLGTSGTFTGTGKKLKLYNKNIQLIALQPNSPMHGLEGWKHMETAMVPGFFDQKQPDAYLPVDTSEAYQWIQKIAESEGLMLSPSAAANVMGAAKTAEQIDTGTIVTMLPDNAEKYSEIITKIFSL
jgi:cysteine synthase B